MSAVVRIKKLSGSAHMPERRHEGDAGFDLYANEEKVIPSLGRERIRTGIAMEIPAGFEGQIRPRSGMAGRFGVTVLNAPGTIDSSFRGEVEVLLVNLGSDAFHVTKGQRIAQLIFSAIESVELREVGELKDSPRGAAGFGSTDE